MDDGTKENVFSIGTNPMLNDLVLYNLFGFLDGSNLKSCRQVCTKWRRISESRFRKACRVGFLPLGMKFENKSDEQILEKYFSVFPPTAKDDAPFAAVTFRGLIGKQLFLKYFHSANGLAITDLKFESVQLTDTTNEQLGTLRGIYKYNFRELINGNILTRVCIEGKSSFDNLISDFQMFTVDFDYLKYCKYLRLSRCHINLNAKITPTDISIEQAFYSTPEKYNPNEVLINDYVDFSKCKKMDFHCRHRGELQLDMKCALTDLKIVSLRNVSVLNWDKAPSVEVDEMNLENFPSSDEHIALKVKYMNISYWDFIHLGTLNESLVKLTIHGRFRFKNIIQNGQTPNLPNLKSLHFLQSDMQCLYYFQMCTMLQDLEFVGYTNRNNIVDVDAIPASVRRIYLENVILNNRKANVSRPVDVLVLHKTSINGVNTHTIFLKPQTLVLCHPLQDTEWSQPTFEILLDSLKQDGCKNLVIGAIDSSTASSLNRILEENVGEAKFCRFDTNSGEGNAIQEKEFSEYFDFCHEDSWEMQGRKWKFNTSQNNYGL